MFSIAGWFIFGTISSFLILGFLWAILMMGEKGVVLWISFTIVIMLSLGSGVMFVKESIKKKERLEIKSRIDSLLIEIPNITTCKGTILSEGIKCEDGTLYRNATYVIRDTIWKE